MKIIFAQGNPGDDYAMTRHNMGFYCIDYLATQLGVSFLPKPKFHADIAETTIEGEKVLLVKPATYYNETGHAARALVDFYKLSTATDFVVIHDELALPFGTLRTRIDGSDAGNNGIKSLNAHLGPQYARIRVGTYSEERAMQHDVNFVLGKFNKKESELLPAIAQKTAEFAIAFVHGNFTLTKVSVL